MPTHVTRWPITDPDMTTRQLIAEAALKLPDIIDAARAVMVGDPVWTFEAGDVPVLVATTPVNVISHRTPGPWPGAPLSIAAHRRNVDNGTRLRDAAVENGRRNREAIAALHAENPHLTAKQIGQAIGLHPDTVTRHLRAIRQASAA